MTSKNRRRVDRERSRLTVRFFDPETKKEHMAFTANLSPWGLFLVTTNMKKIGSILQLKVELDGHELSLTGVVTWHKQTAHELHGIEKPGFGIKVTQAPEQWFSHFFSPCNRGPTVQLLRD